MLELAPRRLLAASGDFASHRLLVLKRGWKTRGADDSVLIAREHVPPATGRVDVRGQMV